MRMLEEELSFCDQNRKRRLPERAGFPTPKTFANHGWTQARLLGGLAREDVATCAFARDARSLVLYGPVGTGKTHMCVAVGTAACEMGMPVRYLATTELVMPPGGSKEDGTLAKLLRQLARADILILDEFGNVPVDRDGARLLFQVISEAYERQSLVITTNLDFSRWGTVLTDDQMAAAIIDRGPPRSSGRVRGRVLSAAPRAHADQGEVTAAS